jgi:dipeptidyl aminopeptidase/acylaminoacyl peptidase
MAVKQVQLTPPRLRVYEPRWSPDDAQIAFGAVEAGLPEMLYVIRSAGGEPEAHPGGRIRLGRSELVSRRKVSRVWV